MGDQGGEGIPALFERQTLHRRSQVETNHRRRVGARQLGELGQDMRGRRPLLRGQLNGPGADRPGLDQRGLARSRRDRAGHRRHAGRAGRGAATAVLPRDLATEAPRASPLPRRWNRAPARMRLAWRAYHSLGELCRATSAWDVSPREIHRLMFGVAEADLEDAAVRAVVAVHVVVVALVLVVPVDHEEAAVGPGLQADDLRPDVVCQQEVRGVRADESRAARNQDIAIEPGAVDVVHEQRAVVLGGPGAAQSRSSRRSGRDRRRRSRSGRCRRAGWPQGSGGGRRLF